MLASSRGIRNFKLVDNEEKILKLENVFGRWKLLLGTKSRGKEFLRGLFAFRSTFKAGKLNQK